MLLSGDKAAMHRVAMVSILSRYYAGDDSLTDEIENNAASTSAVTQMARNSLASEGALENPKKRARMSVETFSTEISAILTHLTHRVRDKHLLLNASTFTKKKGWSLSKQTAHSYI
jgi:hypothetical protein